MTGQMLRDGEIFEYWAHAAAFLPVSVISVFPYLTNMPSRANTRFPAMKMIQSKDMNEMSGTLLKLSLGCLLCIAFATGIALIIQYIIR